MLTTPEKEWISFRDELYGQNLPPDQARQLKLAFFAGGLSIFTIMVSISRIEPEEKAMEKTGELFSQLEAFFKKMSKEDALGLLTQKVRLKYMDN